MTSLIEVVYSNKDLVIVPIFEVDSENLFIEFEDNVEFIKQASLWYLRTHYKIDPEILGLSYTSWNFFDDGTQGY